VYRYLNVRFLLLAEALFNLNVPCGTVFSLLEEKGVHLMECCPADLLHLAEENV